MSLKSLNNGLSSVVGVAVILASLGGCEKNPRPAEGETGAGGAAGKVTTALSVGKVTGTGIQLRDKSDGQWKPHRVGQTVRHGAALRTAAGARARFAMAGGVVLHLNEETELTLAGAGKLRLTRGALLVEQGPGEAALSVVTPSATVSLAGNETKAHLRVDRDTIVDVTRGSAELQGASGARVAVGAGERGEARKGAAPRVSLSRDLSGVTRWARQMARPAARVQQAEQGFGSLTARVPGRGKSHALRLASHQVRVVIRDNVARTEIEQSYYNASGQTLEGTFRFPLPADASISRLALYVGNRLEEGEIVERHRARRIFRKIVEDTIRPRDPALLEWMGGREFSMKIFPIPPRSARRVILAYTQPLKASYGRYRYVYPMSTSKAKATRIGKFSVDLALHSSLGLGKVHTPLYPVLEQSAAGEGRRLRYEASDFSPAASFVVDITPARQAPELQLALYEAGATQACAVRRPTRSTAADPCGDRGGFFMAVLRPELPANRRATVRDTLFLMDSSRSTGKHGWALQVTALQAFLSEMDLRSRFTVMACDATCRTWRAAPVKPTADHRKAALAFARGVTAGGSSNIQEAFREAAGVAAAMGRGARVIYMGDGKPTAGELREPELARLVVRRLRAAGASLSALSVGDDTGALFLSQATRQLSGAVHHLDAGDDVASRVFDLVAAQYRPTLTGLELSVDGVDVHHLYPRTLSSVTAGSEVVVVGRYDRVGQGAIVLKGRVGGRTFSRRYPVKLSAAAADRQANAFIPRFWARQHLDALTMDGYDRNRPEIVRVSKAYTIMSRATAFLVLENERMYREFGVKRRRVRHRGYWKGKGVSTRTTKNKDVSAADGATATAASEKAPAAEPNQKPADLDSLSSVSGGAGKASSGRAALEDKSEREQARGPAVTATPRPMARPTPAPDAARPMPRKPKPMTKAKKSKPRRTAARPLNPFDRSSARRVRRPYYVTVRRARIQPMLAVSSTRAELRSEARLQRLVKARPLRRYHRRALHRRLVLSGQYDRALTHAATWAGLDGSHAGALGAVADMQAAAGHVARAMRSHAGSVEVRPYSRRLHRSLARMYRNKGDLNRSCSHLWSIMSLRPSALRRHLDLARCLATIPARRQQAVRLLTELSATPLGRRHASLIGRTLVQVQAATAPSRVTRTRGPLVVSATWSLPVDLDVALVTPRGERICALRDGRYGQVERDSRDGLAPEVLRLRYAPSGTYRVEITRPAGAAPGKTITGTILVRALGKSQTIPFSLASASTPVAGVQVTTHRVRGGYYR